MRPVTLTTLAIAAVAIVACEQQPADRSPTAPDAGISYAKSTGGPCDAATARTISAQQADLWARPELTQARDLFALVTSNCGTQTGKNLMLDYIQWTIDNRLLIITQKTGTKDGNLLNHWNTVFPYVGYSGQDQPLGVPTTIFTAAGAAGVITQATENRELRTPIAAITVPVQDLTGDQRSHLFIIYPLNDRCLTGSNLRQYEPCYEFASYPKVQPVFDPMAMVGICQPEGPNHNVATAALGHLKSGFVEIPDQQTYPTCLNAYGSIDDGSWTGGFGGVLKRVASLARRTFGVQSAYAVHGGLGGLGGGLSPFGGVDLEVFRASFENETVGTKPTTPEVGTWFAATVTPPGSIAVQNSLGESATGKIVVLNQAGGACRNCGGLLLQGNLHVEPGSVAPNYGIYDVSWISLQDGPTMKEASFKLRDTDNKVIAQVTYTVKSNVNKILYNGLDTGIPWVQHKPNSIRIRVDLNSPRNTTLWIDGTTPVMSNVPFKESVSNFSNVAADFLGIDSGIIGWDQIIVERKQDSGN